MATPTIYTLQNDAHAARFGLQPWERDQFMQNCFRDRGGMLPAWIICHVQEGTTVSSLDWSINKPGDGNSYTVTAQLDGSLLECIPEKHAPWTNGAVRKPTAAGRRLTDLPGNANLPCLTIEAEGYSSGAHPEAQIAAILWQIHTWQLKYGIDNDHVLEHADVDSIERANCAGPYYDKIRARLAGTDPMPTDPQFGQVVNFSKPIRITCQVDTLNVRQWGETDAAIVHELKHGETAWATGYVYGEKIAGTQLWYVLSGRGYRAWSGGTDRLGLPPGQ